MHAYIFLTPLLALRAAAWPHPANSDTYGSSIRPSDGHVSGTGSGHLGTGSTTTSRASGTGGHNTPTSTSTSTATRSKTTAYHSKKTRSHISGTGHHSPTTSTPSTTTEKVSRTWEVTETRTSYVPVSTSVTEIGSKTYYSTWISVIYPTTVVTSTEYITSTIPPVPEVTMTTVTPGKPSFVTVECVCPAPVTETVYIIASSRPATTITSAVLHTYTSTLPNGYTVTTVVPEVSTSTSIVRPSTTTSTQASIGTISQSTSKRHSATGTGRHTRPTGTGGHAQPTGTGIPITLSRPVVSQISDGQVQATSAH